MLSFDDYKLGDTSELIQLESRDDNYNAAINLMRQCTRNLEIISRDLDPTVYDTADFVEAMKQIALQNRFARIRILVFEPEKIVRQGHRIIEIANHLSSYFDIKKAGTEHKDYNEELLLADETGYLHRNNAERYEGQVNFNDKRQSKYYLQQFEEMWSVATPDPNLRRLNI